VNAAFGGIRITRIVIAHRPETIRMSERVVMLEQGKVRSMGSPSRHGDLRQSDDREHHALGAPLAWKARPKAKAAGSQSDPAGTSRPFDLRSNGASTAGGVHRDLEIESSIDHSGDRSLREIEQTIEPRASDDYTDAYPAALR
jgi:hypothetical protein